MSNRSLSIVFLLVFVALGCNDEPRVESDFLSPLEQFEKETDSIDAYLMRENIVPLIDSATQLRYVVNEIGNDTMALSTDVINIDYEGRFLATGNVFDAGDSVFFTLSRLIPGWRFLIPKIGEKGEITMYIPSFYAYGSNGTAGIPPFSTLVFDVSLIDVVD